MTSLSIRQKAMIQTALVGLHHKGVDAGKVVARAKLLIGNKVPPASAWDQAVQTALNSRPELRRSIERDVAQVKASDDATCAAYDKALSTYIATEDPGALAPVMRMAVRDAVQLGIKSGEISAVDVAAGRIDFAKLGMDAANAAAVYDAPEYQAAPQPAAEPQTFAFAAPGLAGAPATGDPSAWSSTGGYIASRSAPAWQNAAPPGDVD